MKRPMLFIVIIMSIGIATASGYLGFFHGQKKTMEKNSQPFHFPTTVTQDISVSDPVATVNIVPLRKGTLVEDITAYGTVVPAPGAVQTISEPFEIQIRHIFAIAGQKVSPGEVLLEVDPGPDTRLQVEESRNNFRLAKEALDHMQQRYDLKLATIQQLLQTKQVFQDARLRLENLRQRGIREKKQVVANVDGLINKVNVHEGDIVPASMPLVEIIAHDRIEARLGVEPEDINRLRIDQPVSLFSVYMQSSQSVTGRIRAISRYVNPVTRLIDLFVAFPPSAEFLPGEYIQGKITISSRETLIVPRTAALPEGDHYVIFTVKEGHVQKQSVHVGLETDKDIEVISENLWPGDLIVAIGNYELHDGMEIKGEESQ
ncbi:MAG: efflux RND transporter periplasmic adaptor subunit [Candidatus Brocadia sp.]